MSLDTTTPADGDGKTGDTKVSELAGAIRYLKGRLNDGYLQRLGYSGGYIDVQPDGEIRLVDNARVKRHVRVAAPEWTVGGTAPTKDFIGIYPVWKFDAATDDDVHFSLIIPYRMAAETTINVGIDWAYTGAQDNGTVCWKLEYLNTTIGEAVNTTVNVTTTITAASQLTGVLVRTSVVAGISGAIAHDVLGLRLWRDVSADTLGTSADLIQTHFEFIMDKLGEAL